LAEYLVVLMILVLATLLAGGALWVAGRVGPAHTPDDGPSSVRSPAAPPATARRHYATNFFLVAILFVVFGVAVVFFLPWGVAYQALGAHGLSAIALFTLPLVVGLLYEWLKGDLEW
jgi:NADH-quinone oxidoreductase subunit A